MTKIIDANELTIEALLNSSTQAYKVPRHQRQFEWTREQWSDLWEDIHTGQVEESHFLGSIVVIPEGRPTVGINYFEINDGQQRLTTILVLLSVIRDHAANLHNSDFATHISGSYLTANCFEGGAKKIFPKLALGKLDNEEFRAVLDGKLQSDRKDGHRIFECYNYFRAQIENLGLVGLENLEKRIVNKIIVVHINVADQFNAFRLFETLNDRGLALSAVDLIKNHLLMRAANANDGDDSVVDSIVEEWQEMYEKIRDYYPVTFFHRFMLTEYPGKISERQLYEVIKKRAIDEKWDAKTITNFTQKLNKAASIYIELIDANTGNVAIDRRLSDIKLFEAGPSYTLLLKVAPLLKSGDLGDDQFTKIIDLIESFHIRWGVCGQSTSRLNDIYNKMCMQIGRSQTENIVDLVEDEYLSWSIPINDAMFNASFQEEFAQPSSSRVKYIIWKLGKPTGETSLNFDEVHTEHILPQTLSEEWIKNIEKSSGLDQEMIKKNHAGFVNRIGNLALIRGDWNISMSNHAFQEKVKHYEQSKISTTSELANKSDWTFDDIATRTKDFSDQAVAIWKFNKPIPETAMASIDSDAQKRFYEVSNDVDLFCKGPSADALANIIDNSIIRVKKGSRARLEVAPTFIEHNYKKLRDQLVNNGVLVEDGPSLVFTSDYDFNSPSAAAAVVLGRSANGLLEWRDENGKTLDQK